MFQKVRNSFLPIIIYKVLKQDNPVAILNHRFLPIIIYKVLKPCDVLFFPNTGFLPIIIYKVLKQTIINRHFICGFLPIIIYKVLKPNADVMLKYFSFLTHHNLQGSQTCGYRVKTCKLVSYPS